MMKKLMLLAAVAAWSGAIVRVDANRPAAANG